MKKFIRNIMSMLVVLSLALSISQISPVYAKGKSKSVYTRLLFYNKHERASLNGIEFRLKQRSDDYNKFIFSIYRNNKKTIITDNAANSIVTNGVIVFYTTIGQELRAERTKNTIWQYDIRSGKKKRLISGVNYTVCQCSGSYLYCGNDYIEDGVKLYAYDLSTPKKKYMADGVASVACSKKRVLTSKLSGDAANYPIYLYHLDGTGKKKVVDGFFMKANEKKIYYGRYKFIKNHELCKIYTCDWNGKNKKAVTKWLEKIPDKYWE